MNEHELERLAARMGEGAASRLDAEKITERVMARLDEARVVSRAPTRTIRWIGGLAAAAMVVIALGLALQSGPRLSTRTVTQNNVLQELDDLGVTELEQLLQTMPSTAATLPQESVPLHELDTLSLKRLLRTLEG